MIIIQLYNQQKEFLIIQLEKLKDWNIITF